MSDELEIVPESEVPETHSLYLAIGPFAWGRSTDRKEAVANCRKHLSRGTHEVYLFRVPPETQVNGMGGFQFYAPEGKTWDDIDFDAWTTPHLVAREKVRKR